MTEDAGKGAAVTVKILGKEYRLRGEGDPDHVQNVAAHVDRVLREVQRTTPDTVDAAILGALNIASELLQLRAAVQLAPRDRLQALIDLVDSA